MRNEASCNYVGSPICFDGINSVVCKVLRVLGIVAQAARSPADARLAAHACIHSE